MGKESKKEWIDSQMALVVKNLPADAGATEAKAGSPGGVEDPLEESVATSPAFLPGESPWTEEPGGLQSIGLQGVRHD